MTMANPTTRERILEAAAAEVGTTEAPPDSNRTKYGKWFGLDGVPWCAIFVSWCYAQAGRPIPAIGYPKGFAGCQSAAAFFRKKGLIVTDPRPGDIVLFDWNSDGRYDHTGIYVADTPGKPGRFHTLEGNTAVGNDSNGGRVMRRIRDRKYAIFARLLP